MQDFERMIDVIFTVTLQYLKVTLYMKEIHNLIKRLINIYCMYEDSVVGTVITLIPMQ